MSASALCESDLVLPRSPFFAYFLWRNKESRCHRGMSGINHRVSDSITGVWGGAPKVLTLDLDLDPEVDLDLSLATATNQKPAVLAGRNFSPNHPRQVGKDILAAATPDRSCRRAACWQLRWVGCPVCPWWAGTLVGDLCGHDHPAGLRHGHGRARL